MMSKQIRDQLVLLASSGKISYRDIKAAIPELDDAELRIASLPMAINDLSKRVLDIEHLPNGDLYKYEFAAEDKFVLSVYGEDLLYQLQKERRQEKLIEDTLKATRISKWYAMIAAIGTIISVLIALYQLR